jgi:hypothetical protein
MADGKVIHKRAPRIMNGKPLQGFFRCSMCDFNCPYWATDPPDDVYKCPVMGCGGILTFKPVEKEIPG